MHNIQVPWLTIITGFWNCQVTYHWNGHFLVYTLWFFSGFLLVLTLDWKCPEDKHHHLVPFSVPGAIESAVGLNLRPSSHCCANNPAHAYSFTLFSRSILDHLKDSPPALDCQMKQWSPLPFLLKSSTLFLTGVCLNSASCSQFCFCLSLPD